MDKRKNSTRNEGLSIKMPSKAQPQNFSKSEVNLQKTPLFFPEGFEKPFLAIYIASLPYVAGLVFLFFVVGDGVMEKFIIANKNSPFMLTWAIGYEIIAALTVLWIIKMSINFSGFTEKGKQEAANRPFQRPR